MLLPSGTISNPDTLPWFSGFDLAGLLAAELGVPVVPQLIFLNKGSLFTLSLGLQQYQSLHFTAFNYLMAAAFVFALPVLLAFIFAQRFFVEGIALTGLQG